MYFQETQIEEAAKYLKACKKLADEDEYYCCMPEYFDGEHPVFIRGITLRAECLKDTFYIFITPHWEAFRYTLFWPDYHKMLTTGFLVDKVREVFNDDEKYIVKVDNRQDIFSGDLYEGFYECVESKCFIFTNC